VIAMLLPSCTKSTKTSTSTTVNVTNATTTTVTGNWWSVLGTPQAGGELNIRANQDITDFDPYANSFNFGIMAAWMEKLFADNWTVNPSTYSYQEMFRGADNSAGQLAQTWEFADPTTLVVHLRQNVYWQNIPPANGRQFIASDVVAHYMRMYDSAKGSYTLGGPHATTSYLANLTSITATDNYTVTFKWNTSNPEYIYECLMLSGTSENCIENPEAVTKWGNLNDWHDAIGTGPFMLSNFVDGVSATLAKNPNYWGIDERYPQNKLPYINQINVFILTDNTVAQSALRTGKIDAMDGMSVSDAQAMNTTNSEILQIKVPATFGGSIGMRQDGKPFNDIKVREAMQMAIDLQDIAKNYYLGAADPWPSSITSNYMTGWGYPFSEWSQDLKDTYAYNVAGAKALLTAAGYPTGFNTDIVVDSGYDMDLLKIIKNDFAAINVNMTITTMDNASWQSFVSTQHKEDAFATSTGTGWARSNEPLTQMAVFTTGGPVNFQMISDPVYDAFYPAAEAATSLDGVKQVFANMNKYVAQQHFVISLLQPMTYSLVQPWLKGYNGQDDALSGPFGISLLGFYAARFWIDQGMKTSMSH